MNNKYFQITYNFDKLSDDEKQAIFATAQQNWKDGKAVSAGWESVAKVESDGWISVDDGLPNPEQEIKFLDDSFEPKNFYFVQLKSGFIDTVYYATICDDCEYSDIFISCTVNVKENRYCVQERGFDGYSINEVKYWQPLPQPPKE